MRKRAAVVASHLRFDVLNSNRTPNYFELLGLSESFELDADELQRHWKARAAQVHPDRYAAASAPEKRVAMQWSAQINEGYRTLRDPVSRARYMCEINGHPFKDQPGNKLDGAFLEQQMEWREALEDIRDASSFGEHEAQKLQSLSEEVEQARLQFVQQVAQMIRAQCWPEALAALHQWMFVDKFNQEVSRVKSATS